MWRDWKVLSGSGKTNIDYMPWAFTQTSERRCQVYVLLFCVFNSWRSWDLFLPCFCPAYLIVCLTMKIELLCFSERAVPGPVSLYCSKWGRTHPGGGPDYSHYQVKVKSTGCSFFVLFDNMLFSNAYPSIYLCFQSRSWGQGVVERGGGWKVGCSNEK